MSDQLPWRFIIDPPLSPARNMAIDEAIAIAFSSGKVPPTLRLYQWARPSFSIGTFQKLDPGWLDHLNRLNVAIVRRITGGRGLFHDRDLTYSVVASTKDARFSGGIRGTFRSIANGLLAGLEQVGVQGKIYAPPHGRRLNREKDPLCFSSTSWCEITAGGKKLIGSAQRRWHSHFLQHGSLILETRSGKYPRFFSDHQISLSLLLENIPPIKILEQGIKSGFEEALTIRFVQGKLTQGESDLTERLIREKHGNDQWTLYRKSG
ncbi:MAG: biotin/lipoate A/B protein ligase family protein [Nitrospiria bacterium]